MFTCCWSVKGGVGVTVVAAALAIAASRSGPVTLVDLCGDVPAALGMAEPVGDGIAEWSRGRDGVPPPVACAPGAVDLRVMPRGRGPFGALREVDLAVFGCEVVVDVGRLDRPDGPRARLAARAERSLLVTRACYLGLRRAATLGIRPHGVVLVREEGRALGVDDIAAVVGAPVVAEIPVDASVGRAVDAGLLASRCPHALLASLGALR